MPNRLCFVCRKMRREDKLGVHEARLLPDGPKRIIRYCRDNPGCVLAATTEGHA